jgi:hypothetical protein
VDFLSLQNKRMDIFGSSLFLPGLPQFHGHVLNSKSLILDCFDRDDAAMVAAVHLHLGTAGSCRSGRRLSCPRAWGCAVVGEAGRG